MRSKPTTWTLRVAALLLVFAFVLVTYEYLPGLISTMGRLLGERGALAAIVYVLIMAAGIVVLPFSSLPLIPIAAAAWGVFWGGTLSILGWWVGSILAFVIAPQFGRPVVRFRAYALGSIVGMAPFGYVLFAMGGAAAEGAWTRLLIIGAAGAVGAYLLYWFYRWVRNRAAT